MIPTLTVFGLASQARAAHITADSALDVSFDLSGPSALNGLAESFGAAGIGGALAAQAPLQSGIFSEEFCYGTCTVDFSAVPITSEATLTAGASFESWRQLTLDVGTGAWRSGRRAFDLGALLEPTATALVGLVFVVGGVARQRR